MNWGDVASFIAIGISIAAFIRSGRAVETAEESNEIARAGNRIDVRASQQQAHASDVAHKQAVLPVIIKASIYTKKRTFSGV